MATASRLMALLVCALGFILLPVAAAQADSAPNPRQQIELSENGNFRVVLDPFVEEAAAQGRVPTLRPDNTIGPAADLITLQRSLGRDDWQTVWSRLAPGEIGGAPERALVSGDGRWVVTVGNHYAPGYTAQEVVIYDHRGRMVRSFSVEDLTSRLYLANAPRSISSIMWLLDARLDNRSGLLELAIAGPESDFGNPWSEALFIRQLRLSDGEIIQLPSTQQSSVDRQLCSADRARYAYEIEIREEYGVQATPLNPVAPQCVTAASNASLAMLGLLGLPLLAIILFVVIGTRPTNR